MLEIGIADARQHLGALLDRVIAGEQIVITQDGEQVALLFPTQERLPIATSQAQALQAAARIRQRAAALKLDFDWNELKALRDEGRR